MPELKDYVIRVSKDTMGRGDDELGKKLLISFFNVLPETDEYPSAIVFYNRAVFMCTPDSEILDILKDLEAAGVKLLCCGTCLNYFELGEKLAVGSKSNMFEITKTMQEASKVIPL